MRWLWHKVPLKGAGNQTSASLKAQGGQAPPPDKNPEAMPATRQHLVAVGSDEHRLTRARKKDRPEHCAGVLYDAAAWLRWTPDDHPGEVTNQPWLDVVSGGLSRWRVRMCHV